LQGSTTDTLFEISGRTGIRGATYIIEANSFAMWHRLHHDSNKQAHRYSISNIYIIIHSQADATSQYKSCIEVSEHISIQARTYITEAYPFARQHNLQSV
jgi:hypothetical protein